MSRRKGQTETRAGIASVFGVALPTVDGWVRNGCPFVQRGSRGVEWQFNTADVSKWLQTRAREEASGESVADEAELKRRKLAAETAKAELELAKAKGDVAPIREFERAQSMMMAAIRANVMQVPSRAVLQLLGETSEAEFKAKLRAELVLALETAAESDMDMEDEESEVDQIV